MPTTDDDDLAAVAAEYGFNPALVRQRHSTQESGWRRLEVMQNSLVLNMARAAVVRVQRAMAVAGATGADDLGTPEWADESFKMAT